MKISKIIVGVKLSKNYNSYENAVEIELNEEDSIPAVIEVGRHLVLEEAQKTLELAEKTMSENKKKKADEFLKKTEFGQEGKLESDKTGL